MDPSNVTGLMTELISALLPSTQALQDDLRNVDYGTGDVLEAPRFKAEYFVDTLELQPKCQKAALEQSLCLKIQIKVFQETRKSFEVAFKVLEGKTPALIQNCGNSPDGVLQHRTLHIQQDLMLTRQRLDLIKIAVISLVALIGLETPEAREQSPVSSKGWVSNDLPIVRITFSTYRPDSVSASGSSSSSPTWSTSPTDDQQRLRNMLGAEGLLQELTAETGWIALSKAIVSGNPEIVKHILQHGADIHATVELRGPSAEYLGRLALFKAVRIGKVEIVRHFLEHGANILTTSLDGRGVLYEATRCGDSTMVGFLLEKGADVNVVGPHSQTPLLLANSTNNYTISRQLIAAGADMRVTNV